MELKSKDKQLLLQDLCGRLPYGVKIEITWWVMGEGTCINTTLELDHIDQLLNDNDDDTEIKPYLFPLSSMTEEQRKEWHSTMFQDEFGLLTPLPKSFDWLNAHQFDYRGLIEKSLALDATNLNIY